MQGTLAHRSPTCAVIDVGGVGYRVAISLATFEHLPAVGEAVRLLTHTYVREDRLELFGFVSDDEREMFELLIGVSGIGPNSAIGILSGTSVADLQNAIFQGQAEELTKIRGIGKKTADRVIVDLQDKIRAPAATPADRVDDSGADPELMAEAIMALVALGIPAPSARKAAASALKRGGPEQSLQELIRHALQER